MMKGGLKEKPIKTYYNNSGEKGETRYISDKDMPKSRSRQ